MQIQKSEKSMAGTRVEVAVNFSKNMKDLSDTELSAIVNSFRRHKAERLAVLRKINPDFGKVDSHSHVFDRDKVVSTIKGILKNENRPAELMDENYANALNIVDWYNLENKKQAGKEKEKTASAY